MKSLKLLCIVSLAVAVTFLSVSTVLAGGWHEIGPTHDPDAGLWADAGQVPHEGLATSSNQCRTCHAVHNADNTGITELGDGSAGTGSAFKLLRNETRLTECYFCHGVNGALTTAVKKPYGPMMDDDTTTVISPLGEHTLGATDIPDSTVDESFIANGLGCGNCHSVHGGWTLNGLTGAGALTTRILKRDPAMNGGNDDASDPDSDGTGAAGGVGNVEDQGDGNKGAEDAHTNAQKESEYLAAFCGDCHNKNVSWDDGGGNTGAEGDSIGGTVSEGDRPNKFAHPLGNIDGLIDVYGKLDKVEDATVTTWINANNAADSFLSCDDCHKSRRQQAFDNGNSPASGETDPGEDIDDASQYGKSKFPHQSVGQKLLSDNYTDAVDVSQTQGDPDRVLSNLDAKVCRTCHGEWGTFGGIGNPGDQNTF